MEIDMTLEISDSVYYVGVMNPGLRNFDIVMRTNFGTSYNSYIIKDDKTVLIDICHEDFWDIYINNIKKVCEPSQIDYIIINHTEPDHSGSLVNLLKLTPNAKIFCSRAASIFLKEITNLNNLRIHIVNDEAELEIGKKKIKFISAPFLHWPDTIFSCLDNKILFSCDFFGTHYCEPYLFDNKIKHIEKYETELKNYYDVILSPFSNYVLNAIDKISDVRFDMICTGHGPILTKDPNGKLEFVISKYKEWANNKANIKNSNIISIFYCSAYGNTRKLAESIRVGIESVCNNKNKVLNVESYDMIESDINFLCDKINSSKAFMIGTPTINHNAVPIVWQLLSGLDAINNKNKPCASFGSYGWSGEASDLVNNYLNQLKLKVYKKSCKIHFVPNTNDLNNAKIFGADFANTIF
jgi:flavorubredoxin